MNKIIETYYDRKMAELEAAKDEAIIDLKCGDANYATLRNLKHNNEKCADLINLGAFVFSDDIKAEILEVRRNLRKAVADLTALVEEADAMFDMAETYEDQVKVLKSYGILKKDGTINA